MNLLKYKKKVLKNTKNTPKKSIKHKIQKNLKLTGSPDVKLNKISNYFKQENVNSGFSKVRKLVQDFEASMGEIDKGNPEQVNEVVMGENVMGNPAGSKAGVVGTCVGTSDRINKNFLDKLNIIRTKTSPNQANKEISMNFGAKSNGLKNSVRVELLNYLDTKQVCQVDKGPEIVNEVKTDTSVETIMTIKEDRN